MGGMALCTTPTSMLTRDSSHAVTRGTSMATLVGSMLACASATSSLLELRRPHGADGEGPPSHEVDVEFRYAGLA